MPLGAVRLQLDGGRQAAGPLRAHAVQHRVGGQDDVKGARAPLSGWRRTGVVDEVPFDHLQLAIRTLHLQHIGLDGDALNLGGHIIDREVAGRASLGRGYKVARALVGYAHQIGAASRLNQRVTPAGVGGGMGHFAHAGLHVHQHHGVARGGLVGGLVGHCTGDSGSLDQCGRCKQAESKNAKGEPGRSHGLDGVLWVFRGLRVEEPKNNRRSFGSVSAATFAQDDIQSFTLRMTVRTENHACCKCSISASNCAASFSSCARCARKSSSGYLPARCSKLRSRRFS